MNGLLIGATAIVSASLANGKAKLNERLLVYGIPNIDLIIKSSNESVLIENVKIGSDISHGTDWISFL
jgi:hypothetical protein